jgi:hypothetical protein
VRDRSVCYKLAEAVSSNDVNSRTMEPRQNTAPGPVGDTRSLTKSVCEPCLREGRHAGNGTSCLRAFCAPKSVRCGRRIRSRLHIVQAAMQAMQAMRGLALAALHWQGVPNLWASAALYSIQLDHSPNVASLHCSPARCKRLASPMPRSLYRHRPIRMPLTLPACKIQDGLGTHPLPFRSLILPSPPSLSGPRALHSLGEVRGRRRLKYCVTQHEM